MLVDGSIEHLGRGESYELLGFMPSSSGFFVVNRGDIVVCFKYG